MEKFQLIPGKKYKVKFDLDANVITKPFDKLRPLASYNIARDTIVVFDNFDMVVFDEISNTQEESPYYTDFIIGEKKVRIKTKKKDWYDHNIFDLVD